MRVIVTRPAAQAAPWVQALVARGADAVALPLIDIVPPPDADAVRRAWHGLASRRLVVFVSPNAAARFFDERPGAAWPQHVAAASVGPGTAEALRRHGVAQVIEPASDAPSFDSEALWQQLQPRGWQDASVLVVRGDGGREWLADTLRAAGARVDAVCAYRRAAPVFDADRRLLLDAALADPAGHLWLFSSSEAIDHLRAACPQAGFAHARAVATHPRIAARARECGFGVVHETRPGLDAVWACIQSLAS